MSDQPQDIIGRAVTGRRKTPKKLINGIWYSAQIEYSIPIYRIRPRYTMRRPTMGAN